MVERLVHLKTETYFKLNVTYLHKMWLSLPQSGEARGAECPIYDVHRLRLRRIHGNDLSVLCRIGCSREQRRSTCPEAEARRNAGATDPSLEDDDGGFEVDGGVASWLGRDARCDGIDRSIEEIGTVSVGDPAAYP